MPALRISIGTTKRILTVLDIGCSDLIEGGLVDDWPLVIHPPESSIEGPELFSKFLSICIRIKRLCATCPKINMGSPAVSKPRRVLAEETNDSIQEREVV